MWYQSDGKREIPPYHLVHKNNTSALRVPTELRVLPAPAVALVVEGERAIEAFRALAGATDPVKALPGTIRGDYALEVAQNMVHGSDSPAAAAREIEIFFPELV